MQSSTRFAKFPRARRISTEPFILAIATPAFLAINFDDLRSIFKTQIFSAAHRSGKSIENNLPVSASLNCLEPIKRVIDPLVNLFTRRAKGSITPLGVIKTTIIPEAVARASKSDPIIFKFNGFIVFILFLIPIKWYSKLTLFGI